VPPSPANAAPTPSGTKKIGAAGGSKAGEKLSADPNENVFLPIPTEALKNLPRNIQQDVFKHYDPKQKGYLKASHPSFQLLASHVVERVLKWFQSTLVEKNPKLSPKEIADILKKERQFLLPGGSEKEADATPNMTRFLFAKMGTTPRDTLMTMLLPASPPLPLPSCTSTRAAG
jgi:hypothetical protein